MNSGQARGTLYAKEGTGAHEVGVNRSSSISEYAVSATAIASVFCSNHSSGARLSGLLILQLQDLVRLPSNSNDGVGVANTSVHDGRREYTESARDRWVGRRASQFMTTVCL